MRLTGYLVLNRLETGKESMNCTFRLTSSDGANFYLGDNDTCEYEEEFFFFFFLAYFGRSFSFWVNL